MDVVYIMPIRLKNYLRHEKIRCHGRSLSIFNPIYIHYSDQIFYLSSYSNK
ncbi:hypothetical protein ACLBV9_04385 [Staphylococcus succinus]|uniref:hypothetical protein n=1 Tax=Staphylococcus succinus TaxID=61015 RepID=UPI0012EB3163|nr:hypothetical protein [Staphylococcus succinus]MEB8127615.1 hypothetical protein [Staphylococcus succinus]MEB8210443.1 hypothetical protein [Staphylococcus succinus]